MLGVKSGTVTFQVYHDYQPFNIPVNVDKMMQTDTWRMYSVPITITVMGEETESPQQPEQPELKAVVIRGLPASMYACDTVSLAVYADYRNGPSLDVTAFAAVTSSHLDTIAVRPGSIVALAAGTSVITAVYGNAKYEAAIQVLPNRNNTNTDTDTSVGSTPSSVNTDPKKYEPSAEELKSAQSSFKLKGEQQQLVLPANVDDWLVSKSLEVQASGIQITLPASVLKNAVSQSNGNVQQNAQTRIRGLQAYTILAITGT